jgi:hypothetical protein
MRTYTVYFRTGGTANFKWQTCTTLFTTTEQARAKCAELNRMGYPAHYADSAQLAAIGLPETFEFAPNI